MDLFSVQGKTVLVTGGSRGIGLMIARDLVESGARVYISSRKAAVCASAARELSAGGTCTALPADLSRRDECVRLAAEFGARERSLDILVNNAGATWGAPLDQFPEAGWDKILDVNLKGVFYLTQALLPAIRAAATPENPARVINIGSVDGLRAPGGRSFEFETYSYSASKAALHHLTRVLAKRLGSENITVNAIAPGPFDTQMMTAVLAEHSEEVAATSLLGRLGQPGDIAGAVRYLAARAGSYVTGTVLCVDGGMVLA
jgi:NAD(P)-dependent dehydrogenase (short-subunit alcohol dehydrogenase family)